MTDSLCFIIKFNLFAVNYGRPDNERVLLFNGIFVLTNTKLRTPYIELFLIWQVRYVFNLQKNMNMIRFTKKITQI